MKLVLVNEFSTKCISQIVRILEISRVMPFCSCSLQQPLSYKDHIVKETLLCFRL